jgi:hypothetical protein
VSPFQVLNQSGDLGAHVTELNVLLAQNGSASHGNWGNFRHNT